MSNTGTDEKDAINILKKYNILKQREMNVIFHINTSGTHFHRGSLQLNLNSSIMLAGSVLSRIHHFDIMWIPIKKQI